MEPKRPIIPVEEQFAIMADSAPVLIWISGTDKLCYFFNAGWLRFTGRTMEQEYGNGWAEGVHPDDLQRCLDIYINSFDARKEFKMEYRLRRHDGVYQWLLDNGVPRYTADGTFAGYIGSCMVIDELMESDRIKKDFISSKLFQEEKELNEKLIASESRFRRLVQQAPVGIAIFNGRELLIEIANNEILKFWGKSVEIIGKRLDDALPELKGQPFLQLLDDVFTSGKAYYGVEALAQTVKNGVLSPAYYDFIYQPVQDDDGQTQSIMLVAMEVTEQVSAKKAVERAEQMLRMAIDAAEIGTYTLDVKTQTVTASPRLKELFGFDLDEEMSFETAMNQVTDEFRQLVIDGVTAAVNEGKDFNLDYKIIGFHDQKLRWVRAVGKRDTATYIGETLFSGAVLDITKQKADDQRKNDFIGMVSHELKTPLTSLAAVVQVAGRKLKNNPDAFLAGAMDKAALQVKRMSTIINGFLNISRLESGKMQIDKIDFDLEALVKEVIKENELTVSTHIINLDSCGEVIVHADRDKISSVISNLISNAVKYSPKGMAVEVRCQLKEKQVQVSVKDMGMGINPEDLPKIFDRYYRVETSNTKHISGFGIGLYICAEIIAAHQGKIWAESEKGSGSTFNFRLPLNF